MTEKLRAAARQALEFEADGWEYPPPKNNCGYHHPARAAGG